MTLKSPVVRTSMFQGVPYHTPVWPCSKCKEDIRGETTKWFCLARTEAWTHFYLKDFCSRCKDETDSSG